MRVFRFHQKYHSGRIGTVRDAYLATRWRQKGLTEPSRWVCNDGVTPEQQRIAIAEACGWKDIVTTADRRKELVGVDTHKMRLVHRGEYVESILPIPDYLNDLNAIRSAIMALTPLQRAQFQTWLESEANLSDIVLVECTPAQWCEAFLKFIGKWS